MNKQEALVKLAESRQKFLQAISGLSEAEMTTIPVEGTWTIKDLLAHIASWERTCLIPLQDYAAGEPFEPEDIPDHSAWNEDQAKRWQNMSLAEVLEEFEATRQGLLTIVTQLADARWRSKLPAPWGGEATLAELLDGLAWHESLEHLKSIQQWKETGKPR